MTMRKCLKRLLNKPYRESTHGEMIEHLLTLYPPMGEKPVIVEIGSGFTTMTLVEIARSCDAFFYSCDNNIEKVEDLKARIVDDDFKFIIGDSLSSLTEIVQQHDTVSFVFFDSAPSAMHTFREFLIIEKSLKPGSCILIDNAAIPGKKALLTACRKGKILVPYLLASPHWQVFGHPHAGDSMVSAVYKDEPVYADNDYELSGWKDGWKYIDKSSDSHTEE